jgi:hypothetical protein
LEYIIFQFGFVFFLHFLLLRKLNIIYLILIRSQTGLSMAKKSFQKFLSIFISSILLACVSHSNWEESNILWIFRVSNFARFVGLSFQTFLSQILTKASTLPIFTKKLMIEYDNLQKYHTINWIIFQIFKVLFNSLQQKNK